MHVDEIVLQNILKTYGKSIITPNQKSVEENREKEGKTSIDTSIQPKDIPSIVYDQNGQIRIPNDQKKALIDFFQ